MAKTLGDMLKIGMRIKAGAQDEICSVIKVDSSNNQAWVRFSRINSRKDTWNNISKVCDDFVSSLDSGVAKELLDVGYGKAFVLSKDEVVETEQDRILMSRIVPYGDAWTRTESSSREAYFVGTTDRTFEIGKKTDEHLIIPVIILPANLEVVYHESYYYLGCRTGFSGNEIPAPPNTTISYEYDLENPKEITLSFDGSEKCVLTDTVRATDPGKYTAYAEPKEGYTWEGGSIASKTINWEIVVLANKPTVGVLEEPISSAKTSFDYDGEAHFPDYHYNENKIYISDSKTPSDKYPKDTDEKYDEWGEVVEKLGRTEAGSYKNIFTLRDKYTYQDANGAFKTVNFSNIRWTGSDKNPFDGDSATLTYDWEINPPPITYVDIPRAVGDSFEYNGSPQKPELIYDERKVTVILPSDYANVGRYMGHFRLKDKSTTQWVGGGTEDITFVWGIKGIPITTSGISQKGVLTYNGKEQAPRWNNYDSGKMTIDGYTSGIDAGIYEALFTPKPGYTWPDGTTQTRVVKWNISPKAIPFPTLSYTQTTYDGKPQEPVIDYHGYEDLIETVKQYSSVPTDAGKYKITFNIKRS